MVNIKSGHGLLDIFYRHGVIINPDQRSYRVIVTSLRDLLPKSSKPDG